MQFSPLFSWFILLFLCAGCVSSQESSTAAKKSSPSASRVRKSSPVPPENGPVSSPTQGDRSLFVNSMAQLVHIENAFLDLDCFQVDRLASSLNLDDLEFVKIYYTPSLARLGVLVCDVLKNPTDEKHLKETIQAVEYYKDKKVLSRNFFITLLSDLYAFLGDREKSQVLKLELFRGLSEKKNQLFQLNLDLILDSVRRETEVPEELKENVLLELQAFREPRDVIEFYNRFPLFKTRELSDEIKIFVKNLRMQLGTLLDYPLPSLASEMESSSAEEASEEEPKEEIRLDSEEVFEQAKKLINEFEPQKAIDLIDRLPADKQNDKLSRLRADAVVVLVRDLRQRVTTLYKKASSQLPEEKKVTLAQCVNILEDIVRKYPEYSEINSVKYNLKKIKRELGSWENSK